MRMTYGDHGHQDSITKLSDCFLYVRHVHVGYHELIADTLRARKLSDLFSDDMEIIATVHMNTN